jgi:hypothetical protein
VFNIFPFTDQARFRLRGHTNSQNSRLWTAENTHDLDENLLHSLKLVFNALFLENGIPKRCFFKETRRRGSPLNIFCNYTLFTTFLVYLRILNKDKLNDLQYWVAFCTVHPIKHTLHWHTTTAMLVVNHSNCWKAIPKLQMVQNE